MEKNQAPRLLHEITIPPRLLLLLLKSILQHHFNQSQVPLLLLLNYMVINQNRIGNRNRYMYSQDWEHGALMIVKKETMSENDVHYRPNKATPIELPGIAQMKQQAGILMSPYDPTRPRHLLPSILSKSPPGRSSTLPPIQRRDKITRPRKSSVTQNARKPQHDRKSSRGEHVRRMSYEGRKAFSAEPSGVVPAMGKRWEDLIDAATSATEDVDGDRTPVSIISSPITSTSSESD